MNDFLKCKITDLQKIEYPSNFLFIIFISVSIIILPIMLFPAIMIILFHIPFRAGGTEYMGFYDAIEIVLTSFPICLLISFIIWINLLLGKFIIRKVTKFLI
jgi:hypothetical protein